MSERLIGTVAGNYRLAEELGEGGMGKVFRGIDLMIGREVAVKVLRPELMSQPQLVDRFRAEAMALSKLNHPHIALLYSFFKQDEYYFMVLEFVRGERLDHRLRRAGALPYEQALRFFCQILDAIGHAHSLGIIHRDIKPNNIMLTTADEAKVMDFGIARVLGTERMTREGLMIGTPEYMAPEQIRGLEADARTDIYSLGILLYEMICGRLPFPAASQFETMRAHIEDPPPPPRCFVPELPEFIELALLRALAKKPDDRFATVQQFHELLITGDPTLIIPAAQLEQLRKSGDHPALAEVERRVRTSGERRARSSGADQQQPRTIIEKAAELRRETELVAPPPSLKTPFTLLPPTETPHRWLPLVVLASSLCLIVTLLVFAFWRKPAPPPPPTPKPAATPDLIALAGGRFQLGRADRPHRGEDELWAYAQWPAHTVTVAPFSIDRTEVTVAEYAQFIRETHHQPVPPGWSNEEPPQGCEKCPVVNVSVKDAIAFATWRSRRDGHYYRLPTEEEWEFAAKGTHDYRYPWGNDWRKECVGTTVPVPVGSLANCESVWGVQDLLGNVREWTESPASFYPGHPNQAQDTASQNYVVVRGGSFQDANVADKPITVTVRHFYEPSAKQPFIGFRLVRPGK